MRHTRLMRMLNKRWHSECESLIQCETDARTLCVAYKNDMDACKASGAFDAFEVMERKRAFAIQMRALRRGIAKAKQKTMHTAVCYKLVKKTRDNMQNILT